MKAKKKIAKELYKQLIAINDSASQLSFIRIKLDFIIPDLNGEYKDYNEFRLCVSRVGDGLIITHAEWVNVVEDYSTILNIVKDCLGSEVGSCDVKVVINDELFNRLSEYYKEKLISREELLNLGFEKVGDDTRYTREKGFKRNYSIEVVFDKDDNTNMYVSRCEDIHIFECNCPLDRFKGLITFLEAVK